MVKRKPPTQSGFHSSLEAEKLGNIHSPRPTFQNPNVEFMDELGKLMS